MYLNILSFLNAEIALVVETLLVEEKNGFILYRQHHGCWCHGDSRSQGISSNGIDIIVVTLEYQGLIP